MKVLLLSLLVLGACSKKDDKPKKKTAFQEAAEATRSTEELARYGECKLHAQETGDASECEEMKKGFNERTLKKIQDNGL